MPTVAFDTLKFDNTLKEAGVPDDQAEAQARAFAEIFAVNLEKLATKDDLTQSEKNLRQEILLCKDDLKQSEKNLRQEILLFKQEFERKMEQQTGKIDLSRQEFERRMDQQAAKTEHYRTEDRGEKILIRWMMGFVLAGVVTLVIRLLLKPI